ncbi:phosphate/phosphite/phosphonate ABC transporter substrate-binding protein [Kaarinaea lacus]
MVKFIIRHFTIVFICLCSPITFSAEGESEATFVDYVKNTMSTKESERALIFTAPPRNAKKDDQTYTPIIDFLSRTLNRKIEYRKPSGWGDYNKAMIIDVSDIVFDGPHFNAWRMNNLDHKVIVRLPQQQVWKIVVSADSPYQRLEDLTGKKVCLQGATNFGKLNFMSYFPNVMRLPEVIQIKSRQDGYNAVIEGRCVATIVTAPELKKYNKKYNSIHQSNKPPVKVLRTLKPKPNQAFSVSAKLPVETQMEIQKALLSFEGQQAMSVLRDRYANNEKLIEANPNDYKDIDRVLDGSYPFDNPFSKSISEAYSGNKERQYRQATQKRGKENFRYVKKNKGE